MIPHDFEGTNVHASPPPGYEEMIEWLHCFHNGVCCVSAWKPTEDQLAKLNAGESVFVSVMSSQRHDITGKVVPTILPTFVGLEEDVLAVVSDTGGVWK
jgi:hypothetical protein